MLSDFGAVSIMRFDSFTRAIYTSYRGGFDRDEAAALACLLVAVTLVVLWVEGRLRSRGAAYHRSGTGHGPPGRGGGAGALALAGARPVPAACAGWR